MLKITYETEDGLFSAEFKGEDIITWPEVMSRFAALLNAATYAIDTKILDEHIYEAQNKMSADIFNTSNKSNSWDD
jgi:hypothetical protein